MHRISAPIRKRVLKKFLEKIVWSIKKVDPS